MQRGVYRRYSEVGTALCTQSATTRSTCRGRAAHSTKRHCAIVARADDSACAARQSAASPAMRVRARAASGVRSGRARERCAKSQGICRRPAACVPGQGQMKPEQLEIERLRREVIRLRAERATARVCATRAPGAGLAPGFRAARSRLGSQAPPRRKEAIQRRRIRMDSSVALCTFACNRPGLHVAGIPNGGFHHETPDRIGCRCAVGNRVRHRNT